MEQAVKNGTFGKEKFESAKKIVENGLIEKAEKLLAKNKKTK